MTRIGIYIGTSDDDPENIEKQLLAWGQYLDDYIVDIFGSASLPGSVANRFNTIRTSQRTSSNFLEKIFHSYLDCKEYVRSESPTLIIQIWNYPAHAPGLTLAASREGCASITRLTGDHYNEYRSQQGLYRFGVYLTSNLIGRIPLRWSDKMIALGPRGRNELINRGVDEEDVVILPPSLGVESRFVPPESKVRAKERVGLPSDRTVVLYVGRISTRKGMDFLVKAIDKSTRHVNHLFVLVGSGPRVEEFNEKYDNDKVRALGSVPYQDIHRYYKAADVFVYPSPYEGIPLTILEALSCNVPVIARDAGDIEYATPVITSTPEDMARRLIKGNWEVKWLNKDKFSHKYQRETLTGMVDSFL